MKKIVLLLALGSCNQIFIASNNEQIKEFYRNVSTRLTRYKNHGAVIGDINGLEDRIKMSEEFHDINAIDNSTDLLHEARSKIFGRHIIHHFGKEPLIDFIDVVENHGPEASEIIEMQFEQAVINYFATRQAPKSFPESTHVNPDRSQAMIHYLAALRDQEN